MIPITFDTDREAIEAALTTIGMIAPRDARIIQIADTLHLTRVRVSAAYFDAVRAHDRLTFAGEPQAFPFDADGWLNDVPQH
jgi:hypothetical protein